MLKSPSIYTNPKFNKKTQKFEIYKMSTDNNILDVYTSETSEGAKAIYSSLTSKAFQESKNILSNPFLDKTISVKAIKAHRINVVLNFKLLGYTLLETYNLVTDGGQDGTDDTLRWNLSHRTIKRYYHECFKMLYDAPEEEKGRVISSSKKRWEALMSTAVKSGDLTNARESLKQLDKLNGIDQINVNVKVKTDSLSKLSDKELLEKLKEYGLEKDVK